MKCSAYIATSADGFIARPDGSVDWLDSAGEPEKGTDAPGYVDFATFFATVDCMIMGRKCMETISGFNLTPDQWPYGDTRIVVLSRTLTQPTAGLFGNVEMYDGELFALLDKLERDGHSHAYVDGGTTIQSFLALGLMNELILTRMPILIGEGISLFGPVMRDLHLRNVSAVACPSGYVQQRYTVAYDA
ncbi:MAG: dihydrofolate reductase family protein [Paracoccaceae bacterium]